MSEGSKRILRRRGGEGLDYITCRLCHRELQAIGWTHLVSVHRFDPEHPVIEYKRRFGLKWARCGSLIAKMKRALHAHFERVGRRWTRGRVKREIRHLNEQGRRLTYAALSATGRVNLLLAARRLYGSWEKALAACGCDYELIRGRRAWTREKILAKLKEMRRAGEPLHRMAVRDRDPGLMDASLNRFGSWDDTLRAAGMDPERVRRQRPRWTRANVIAAIRKLGGGVLGGALVKTDPGLVRGGRIIFGTWRASVEAAGYDYPKRSFVRKWPRERVLEAIRYRSRRGLSVRKIALEKEAGGLLGAGCREFGTWKRAVEAAGVRYPPRPAWKWPRERILEALRSRSALGRSLRPASIKREVRGLLNATRRQFGSWWRALREAGLRHGKSPWKKWTKERILEEIRARARRKEALTPGIVAREARGLWGASRREFGSWERAVKRALGARTLAVKVSKF